MMDHPTIHSFPEEILTQICGEVSHSHKPSLLSVALVNKRLHTHAAQFIFHTLRLTLCQKSHFDSLVAPALTSIHANTRHLIIKTCPENRCERFGCSTKPWPRSHNEDPLFTSSAPSLAVLLSGGDFRPTNRHYSKWELVAAFVSKLRLLSDFTYNCAPQLDSTIFKSIINNHPSCRIHLEKFHLQSLRSRDQGPIDQYELSLVTSPCLSSVTLPWTDYHDLPLKVNARGLIDLTVPLTVIDYNREAVIDLVAGLAPNLKAATVSRGGGPGLNTNRPSWKGFQFDPNAPLQRPLLSARGALSHLTIAARLGTEHFVTWNQTTDFSVLVRLDIDIEFKAEPFEYMTANCSFRSLKTVTLQTHSSRSAYYDHIRKVGNGYPYEEFIAYHDRAIAAFLQSLPPLRNLKLHGEFGGNTFEALLEKHGESLEALHLQLDVPTGDIGQFTLNMEHLQQLTSHCRNIESLFIISKRTQGDAAEIESYRLLGSLPKLRTLYLTLDASNRSFGVSPEDAEYRQYDADDPRLQALAANDPRFDESEQQFLPNFRLPNRLGLRIGFLRNAFLNCALDQALACAIFRAVAAGKPPAGVALEKMYVQVKGAFEFYTSGLRGEMEAFQRVSGQMFRSWVVERSPRNDCRETVTAKMIMRGTELSRYSGLPSLAKADEIFLSIWPKSKEMVKPGEDWRDNWQSIPLLDWRK